MTWCGRRSRRTGGRIRHRDDKRQTLQWLYEFGKIGNNVNRLAKYCYTLREEADTEQVTMYLYALTAEDQLQAEIRRAL